MCWRGPDESEIVTDTSRLRPGDTVVIPVVRNEPSGWDVFGHIPDSDNGDPVVDIGDRAHLASRAIPILRVHPETVDSWPDSLAQKALLGIADGAGPIEDINDIRELLGELADAPETPGWLRDAARHLSGDRRLKVLHHPGGGFVLRGSGRVLKYVGAATTITTEDDSSAATVRIELEEHLRGVEKFAKRFGKDVGLPSAFVQDVALAALLHDLGKADPRFQTLLHGGNPWAGAPGVLLAKSGRMPTTRAERQRAHHASGYPEGGRHELLSVRLAESAPTLLARANDPELVLYLVASHHGRCRPFAPVVADEQPQPANLALLGAAMSASTDTQLERLDSGVPERFWRLVRRYGWWGLAWLEAILRLADHRCSEEEEKTRLDEESGEQQVTEVVG